MMCAHILHASDGERLQLLCNTNAILKIPTMRKIKHGIRNLCCNHESTVSNTKILEHSLSQAVRSRNGKNVGLLQVARLSARNRSNPRLKFQLRNDWRMVTVGRITLSCPS